MFPSAATLNAGARYWVTLQATAKYVRRASAAVGIDYPAFIASISVRDSTRTVRT